MECYDASAHVYFPRHEEYVGPRDDLTGKCVRCLEITDPQIAAAAAKRMKRAEEEIAQRREEDEENRRRFAERQEDLEHQREYGVRKWR